MKLKPMTIVFSEPTRKRKDFLFSFISVDAIAAAWPEPIPGRKEHNGAANAAAEVVFIISFLERVISFKGFIFCLGRIVFAFMLIIREEIPNKPVSKGKRGSLTGRLNVKRPKNPERIKITREGTISFSERIRKREMKMRINGIIEVIN